MVSHDYKCIFVHIPKSAGTSMATKLGLYKKESRGMQDHRPIKWLRPIDSEFLAKLYQRDHLEVLYKKLRTRLDRRPFVSHNQYEQYFKFTFVRNPWARVHSWYANVLDDPIHMKTYNVPKDASLEWFVRNRLYTVESQLHFIQDLNGKMQLDFIGRYENLYEDFEFVCQTLGIEDYTLPEKTRIGTPSYIGAYDEVTKAIVTEAFQEEIDLFNFEFGDKITEVKNEDFVQDAVKYEEASRFPERNAISSIVVLNQNI